MSRERYLLLQARARFMRWNPTDGEALLWTELRGSRLGVAFRRQVVVGDHIVDFLCRAKRLVVEVDGGSHDARASADAARDRKLRRKGYRVLRLSDDLIRRNLSEAIARIRTALIDAG